MISTVPDFSTPAASIPAGRDPRAVLGEEFWRRPAFEPAAWIRLGDGQDWGIARIDPARLAEAPARLVLALADFDAARQSRPIPPGEAREARPRVRALAVELVLANYRLPRPAVEALVGDPDAAGADPEAWTLSWLAPVAAAAEAAGPRAAFLANTRGGSVRIGPGGMIGAALPG